MDTLFLLSNLCVLPVWVLLLAVPHWSGTRTLLQSGWFFVPIGVLYSVLVLPGFIELLPTLAYPTLPAMQALFGTAQGTTAAWTHLLAFDLWTGRWVFLDAHARGIPGWLRTTCLLSVFMAGPFGLLLYICCRWAYLRRSGSEAGLT